MVIDAKKSNALKENILFLILEWHFSDVPKNLLKAWKNFLRFNLNYFSIPLLLKTLFSPWHKYKWSYGRGLNIKRYISTFASNMISRFLGMFIRLWVIIIGILAEIFIIAAGIFIFIFWIFFPLTIVLGFYYGFRALF